MPHVTSIPKFEHFFRVAGGLDIDKSDIARYDDFINREIEGLLIRAQAAARQNLRDVKVDTEAELRPVLDRMAIRPRLDMDYSDETDSQLPDIAGGLSVALARVFKIIDPKLKHPFGAEWERATRVFNELA